MLSLFIMSIMALALTAVIGYSAFSTMKSTETFAMVQQNTARTEQIARLLEAELRDVSTPLDSHPDVPVSVVNGIQTIPEWIVANNRTPWGVSYGYCPYGPASLGAQTEAYETPEIGKTYLTNGKNAEQEIGGDALPGSMDIAALIISPIVNRMTVPTCAQVQYHSGTGFTVADGTVVAVLRHSPINIGYRKVENSSCLTSATQDVTCNAACVATEKLLFGECSYEGDADPPHLLSFKALNDNVTFQCRWSLASAADKPLRTRVACANVN